MEAKEDDPPVVTDQNEKTPDNLDANEEYYNDDFEDEEDGGTAEQRSENENKGETANKDEVTEGEVSYNTNHVDDREDTEDQANTQNDEVERKSLRGCESTTVNKSGLQSDNISPGSDSPSKMENGGLSTDEDIHRNMETPADEFFANIPTDDRDYNSDLDDDKFDKADEKNGSPRRLSPSKQRKDEDTISIMSSVSSVFENGNILNDLDAIVETLQNDKDKINFEETAEDYNGMKTRLQSASRTLKKCEKFSNKLSRSITTLRQCLSDVKMKVKGDALSSESAASKAKVDAAKAVLAQAALDLTEAIKAAAEAEVVTAEASVAAEEVVRETKHVADALKDMENAHEESNQKGDDSDMANGFSDKGNNGRASPNPVEDDASGKEQQGQDSLREIGITSQQEENIHAYDEVEGEFGEDKNPDETPRSETENDTTPRSDQVLSPAPEGTTEDDDTPRNAGNGDQDRLGAITPSPRSPDHSRPVTPAITVTGPHAIFNQFTYKSDAEDFSQGVCCIMKVKEFSLKKDDIQCSCANFLEVSSPLVENEELVSNIVEIILSEEIDEFKEVTMISLPHCAPRAMPTRELVIKILQDTAWTEVPSEDMVCTEHKDIRFLEGKVDRLSKTTLAAVVTRPKRDRLQVGKRGGKLTSTVDSRIYINVPKGLFKSPTQVYLEVQPLDGALISDFKSRACEDDAFISASAIMTISFQHKLTQPVLLNLPCPGGIKKKRPQTSGVKEKRSAPTRPTTSFGFRQKQDADDTTFVYLLTQNAHGGWVLRADAQLKPSTINDQVAIEWEETKERILLLRCKKMDKKGMVPRIEKLAKAVESFLYKRYVNFIVRQKSSEPRNIIIHPVLANKSERFIKKYAEDGYDDGPVGDDVAVHEGQRLEIKFRGNLQPSPDDYPDLEFVYNTALTEPITFSIAEVEKFAQKSLPIYKGFIQLCCLQSEKDEKEEDKDENVLTEVCVTIPKPETEPPAEVRRAPLEIRTDGPVNNDTLRWLASELATSGDEWKKLSHYLRIPRARLQAIQRNCQGKGNESVIFELLMTWVKKVPRAKDKATILCSALLRCGRLDLAEEMKDHDIDFKEERARSARSASLEKKFKSLSRSESVVSEWKTVASNLHLTTAEIREIEEDYEDENERCYQALQKWKEIDSGANLVTLAETLRVCDLGVAADLVETTS